MSECEVTKVNLPKFPPPELIVLTVEEAKEIAFKLKELSEGYFLSTGNIDSRSVEWSIVLNERIEQTEKSYEAE